MWAGNSAEAKIKAMKPLPDVLLPFTKNRAIWHCPLDVGFERGGIHETFPFDTRPSSFQKYGSSYYYRTPLVTHDDPFHALVTWDAEPPHAENGSSQIGYLYDGNGGWHGGLLAGRRYNMVFIDGHAESISRAEFERQWAQKFKNPSPSGD